jgi:hypothetical protein
MTENSFRNRLGILMVIAHFTIVLFMVGMRVIEYFDDSTLKVSLPIVIPLFATYTTLVVRYLIEHKTQITDKSRQMTPGFVFIASFIPAVFVLFMLLIIIKQAFRPGSIESFAVLLGLGETIFGAYLGYIFKDLFPAKKNPEITGQPRK